MRKITALFFTLSACAPTTSEIHHLSPQFKPENPPRQCRLINVLKDSPAERAGLKIGDSILKVNGNVPGDASQLADLIEKAPAETTLDTVDEKRNTQTLRVALNPTHPRLGAVCDLHGWTKSGLSNAGNESVTLFEGPYAVTLSGIVDDAKGLSLVRAHIVNYGSEPVHVGPDMFAAKDGDGQECFRVHAHASDVRALRGKRRAGS